MLAAAKPTVTIRVAITNVYENGDVVEDEVDLEVPRPANIGDLDDWAYDHLFSATGTGRVDGNAGYFATITSSSYPALVGRKWEWGI